MAKQISTTALAVFTLQTVSSTPLYKQLYERLRQAILSSQLTSGTRLPSTRILASELAISRNTVTSAFRQLLVEGYLESRVGDGTYVAQALPEGLITSAAHRPKSTVSAASSRRLSNKGTVLVEMPVDAPRLYGSPRPFRYGVPALDKFPYDLWARLAARFWRSAPTDLLSYRDPAGYEPLRKVITSYLRTSRAVICDPEQVLIVNGIQHALDLSARVLLDPGDPVWIENPCYKGVYGPLVAAGAQPIPVPVDQEGLNVAAGIQRNPRARMALVTPSHQHPLGLTMALPRRLELLNWAQRSGAWILEDDYGSEYCYASPPLPSLHGMDVNHRVIYMGSFNRALFPALRLGYLVIPPDLLEVFGRAQALVDRQSPVAEQVILTHFIAEGYFTRYVRRMRALYAERQKALIAATRKYLSELLDVYPADAGMHVMGWLHAPLDDRQASRLALERGIEVPPLSAYCLEPYPRQGLLLGYAAFDEQAINDGIKRLAAALRLLR
jgi:GntR family transcriptional regulator / MocR family aminotransferase